MNARTYRTLEFSGCRNKRIRNFTRPHTWYFEDRTFLARHSAPRACIRHSAASLARSQGVTARSSGSLRGTQHSVPPHYIDRPSAHSQPRWNIRHTIQCPRGIAPARGNRCLTRKQQRTCRVHKIALAHSLHPAGTRRNDSNAGHRLRIRNQHSQCTPRSAQRRHRKAPGTRCSRHRQCTPRTDPSTFDSEGACLRSPRLICTRRNTHPPSRSAIPSAPHSG